MERDHLDFYISWSLKNYVSHAPIPKDAKRHLFREVAGSSKPIVKQSFKPDLVLRALLSVVIRMLVFIEQTIVFGPPPTKEQLALSYAQSVHLSSEVAANRQPILHLYPTWIGYFCMIS
jgi:hypothetical protein